MLWRTLFSIMMLAVAMSAMAQPLVLKWEESSTTHQKYVFQSGYGLNDVWLTQDFDGNGYEDMIMSEHPVGGGLYSIVVYGMPGRQLLWSSQTVGLNIPMPQNSPPIFVDFNGDGSKEVIISNATDGYMGVFSTADGSCILEDSLPSTPNPEIYDYDGDNLPDIFVRRAVSSPVEYHYQIWGYVAGAPSAPENLVAQAEGSNVVLNWQGSPEATAYCILWSLTPNGCFVPIDTTTETNYTHLGATAVPSAFYRVSALGGGEDASLIAQGRYQRRK